MKLEANITQVIQDYSDLSITIRGWACADPEGTSERALGTINIPSNVSNRRAYYIGRRIIIDVRPA